MGVEEKMLKVGIIGVGTMGERHARVYSELPNVELVGVSDTDSKVAWDVSKKYHTKAFCDHKDLLKKDLDSVSVAVPTTAHKKIAVDVAAAGIDMLVEKPIADTLKNAEDMIRATNKNNVKLMIGHIERFNPVIKVIKESIKKANVISIDIARVGPLPPRIKDVGVVIDFAIHDIDLIRYLTNSDILDAWGFTSKDKAQNEDSAFLYFKTVNNVLAHITANWLTPFKVREINIATKDKFVKGWLIDQKVVEYSDYKADGTHTVKNLYVPYGEPLKLELAAFLECVKKNSVVPISGYDGLKALEAALKCIGY